MNDKKINLLVVDDEVDILTSISKILKVRDFNVIAVDRGGKAIKVARTNPVDVALVDLRMPGMKGEETLRHLKMEHPWMEVVVLTGHGSIDSAVECTKTGAYSYLQKPCDVEQLVDALTEAYKKKVMNKKCLDEKKMEELFKISQYGSSREILKRLREIDD